MVTHGTKAGGWHDHEKGIGGDLINLIEHVQGGTFREAVTYAEGIIGSVPILEPSPEPATCARSADVGSTGRQRRAAELWRQAVPIGEHCGGAISREARDRRITCWR